MPSPDFERMKTEYNKGFTDADIKDVEPIIPFLRTNVSPWLHEHVKSIPVKHLDHLKEEIVRRREANPSLSRPLLSAILTRHHGGVYTQAQRYLDEGNRGLFSVWYNLAKGYMDSPYCIDRAEGVLRRGPRLEVVHAFEGDLPEDPEEATLRFQRYSELLKIDPTGITLMEYQVYAIGARDLFDFPKPRKGPFYRIYHPVWVLARMHAAEVYKQIYPLTE